ncbi:MAG: hypothetical protein ABIJ23_03630 [Candidatus Magasanikbacteria bacterium]
MGSSTNAIVTINPIYFLDIDIKILKKLVRAGENLSVRVKLKKTDLTEIEEGIEVRLYYEILKRNQVISEGYAGSLNVTRKTKKTIEIPIPSNISRGIHVLKIKANHPQAYSDEDKDWFFVRRWWRW